MYCSSYLPICLFPGVSGEDVEDLHVFLLVCGLRRVKDPLYLLEAFSGTGITSSAITFTGHKPCYNYML